MELCVLKKVCQIAPAFNDSCSERSYTSVICNLAPYTALRLKIGGRTYDQDCSAGIL